MKEKGKLYIYVMALFAFFAIIGMINSLIYLTDLLEKDTDYKEKIREISEIPINDRHIEYSLEYYCSSAFDRKELSVIDGRNIPLNDLGIFSDLRVCAYYESNKTFEMVNVSCFTRTRPDQLLLDNRKTDSKISTRIGSTATGYVYCCNITDNSFESDLTCVTSTKFKYPEIMIMPLRMKNPSKKIN